MNVTHKEINYKPDMPFNAEICHINKLAPHYHETSLEFIYCIEGSVSFVAGFQHNTLHKGDIFSIDCEDIHYIYSDFPNTVLIFHIDLEAMPIPFELLRCVFFACESPHCFPYQEEAMTKVIDMIFSLSFESLSGNSGDYADVLENLFHTLYRHFNYYNYDNPDGYMNIELHDRFYDIIKYCFANYNKKISLSQVADYTHLSKNYVSQFFRQTPFKSFSTMLKDIRCFKAERLLLTGNMSNFEIAYACGFSDPKYMYSAFEMWWGTSPYKHRKSYKDYMKSAEKCESLDSEEALQIMQKLILDWHLHKTL